MTLPTTGLMTQLPGIDRILPLIRRPGPQDSTPGIQGEMDFPTSDRAPTTFPEKVIGLTWADTVDLSRLDP